MRIYTVRPSTRENSCVVLDSNERLKPVKTLSSRHQLTQQYPTRIISTWLQALEFSLIIASRACEMVE